MVISNVVICDKDGERGAEIRVEDGFIVEIGESLSDDNKIDLNGAYIIPSLVDTNVRLNDSVLNSKNIKSLSNEAKKGGVGHIILNADSTPSIDNEVVLEFAQNSLSNLSGAKVDLMLNALKEDMTLSNIAILLKHGAITVYMSTIAKNNLAIKIAEYVKMYDVTLFCKAEDNSLINSGVMLDGDVSSKLGLAGIPELSEVLHVSRMLEIAKHFDISILFKSIASPRSVALITKAKEEGVRVSCEVSINHLVHCDEACEGFRTVAKLNPPLACRDDMLKLQEALKNGEIDILTSLHQPSSPVNKEVAFFDASYGSTSIGVSLPLYYTKLVDSGLITMQELVKISSYNPAKSIKQDAGVIKVGGSADFVIFDTTKSTKVEDISSLFNGEELKGRVTYLG